jgi:hypothetical protein
MKIVKVKRMVVFILMLTIQAFPYNLPIGIPDPCFGISDVRPARPNPWSGAIPGYYYVNQQAGSDQNNPYGAPAKPRKSVPRPAPAGSYIEIHGVYGSDIGETIWLGGNGTNQPWIANVDGPVWIVGETFATKPTFINQEVSVYGTFVYLELLDFKQRSGYGRLVHLSIGSTSRYAAGINHHIVVRKCEIEGDANSYMGMFLKNNDAEWLTNVVIYNNIIHGIGAMAPAVNTDACGVIIDDSVSNIWMLENVIHTISETGARIGPRYRPNSSTCKNIYFGRNTVYNCNHNGLWVKYGQDIIFSQNHIYQINGAAPYPDNVCMGAQYAPVRFWMIYNTLHDASGGIEIASSIDAPIMSVYAIGNVVYDLKNKPDNGGSYNRSGINIQGNIDKYILNNSIYDVDDGINTAPSAGNLFVANNIVANITSVNGRHLNVDNSGIGSAQNNLFNQNNGNVRIRWAGNDFPSVEAFNASGMAQNNKTGAPLFVDAAQHDLRLIANSPARDAGIMDSVYQTFFNLYGVDIKYDHAGAVRPIGGTWDLGAYEYQTDDGVKFGKNMDSKVNTVSFNQIKKSGVFP